MTTLNTGGLGGDYATEWDGFIGQDRAKKQLRKAALSARMRNMRLPHTLLAAGTPGIGKTNLALLTASEYGSRLVTVSGKFDESAFRTTLLRERMRDGDILFIDEIHRLVAQRKNALDFLLNFMQDGVLLGPRGPEEQPSVTIMAATTDAGRLNDALLQRFVLRPVLVPYTDEEAAHIALRLAERHWDKDMPPLNLNRAREVAAAAANAPRMMTKILVNVVDTALAEAAINWTGQDWDISYSLQEMGITADGLTEDARRYLQVMLDQNGGPVGLEALKDELQEPGGVESTERLLMTKGYLTRTGRGRWLTTEGLRRAVDLEETSVLS